MTYNCVEGSIIDQKETGTCWLQAGLSLLSALAARRSIKIRFSSTYLVFFDKLDKARCFLAAMKDETDERVRWHWLHDGPITDGGTWGMFLYLVLTYGLVPHDAMLPTYQAKSSSQINGYINAYLRGIEPLVRDDHMSIDEAMRYVP